MTLPKQAVRLIRFGDFEVDLDAGELRNGGANVKLRGQPVLVLAALLEQPGKIVTREELRTRLWLADTFVDFDHSLHASISRLRDALNDSSESPRFIQTVPRKGYRFVGTIFRETEQPAVELPQPPVLPAPVLAKVLPQRSGARAASSSLLQLGAAAILFALLLLGGLYVGWRTLRPASVRSPITSIAVLPLRNLSGDPSQEYFADGMTEALITSLAKMSSLTVISRTSVMHYKTSAAPVSQIARELGVQAILEGSVARSGNRVRITAQLIDASRDRHLWADTYERNIGDVLSLQDAVAADVAGEVGIHLSSASALAADQHRIPANAYETYLRGQYYWNQRTTEGDRRSLEQFQQAIKLDPEYALAYVGLADAWIGLGYYSVLPPKECFPHAEEAALEALKIDPNLGAAHASLGFVAFEYDWDGVRAEHEFKLATQLAPNYVYSHQWYAEYLMTVGRMDDAVGESKRALQIDPLSLPVNATSAWRFYAAHHADQALTLLRKNLDLDPRFALAHWELARIYEEQGKFSDEIAELKQGLDDSQNDPVLRASLARAYALSGDTEDAGKNLNALRRLSRHQYVSPYFFAWVEEALHDRTQTFANLEKAYDERSNWLVYLNIDPRFSSLHADPRFSSLIARMSKPIASVPGA